MNKRAYRQHIGRATREFKGLHGAATIHAVLSQIPGKLRRCLTSEELGMVMNAVDKAYHNGEDSNGGVDLIDDCVWIPGAEKNDGQLIPLAALRSIKCRGNHYSLNFTEPPLGNRSA